MVVIDFEMLYLSWDFKYNKELVMLKVSGRFLFFWKSKVLRWGSR